MVSQEMFNFNDKEASKRLLLSLSAFREGDLRNWPSQNEYTQKKLRSGLPFETRYIKGPQKGEMSFAVIVGDHDYLRAQSESGRGVRVRLHDGCLYSYGIDLVGMEQRGTMALSSTTRPAPKSHSCDCRAQSVHAQHLIGNKENEQDGGGGIYISIPRNEGRGAGLEVKRIAVEIERKYSVTTADAYNLLGYEFNQRQYEPEINFLKSLGFYTLRLLTNNIHGKVHPLEEAGFTVIREPLLVVDQSWNDYLGVKRDIDHHVIPSDQELRELTMIH